MIGQDAQFGAQRQIRQVAPLPARSLMMPCSWLVSASSRSGYGRPCASHTRPYSWSTGCFAVPRSRDIAIQPASTRIQPFRPDVRSPWSAPMPRYRRPGIRPAPPSPDRRTRRRRRALGHALQAAGEMGGGRGPHADDRTRQAGGADGVGAAHRRPPLLLGHVGDGLDAAAAIDSPACVMTPRRQPAPCSSRAIASSCSVLPGWTPARWPSQSISISAGMISPWPARARRRRSRPEGCRPPRSGPPLAAQGQHAIQFAGDTPTA